MSRGEGGDCCNRNPCLRGLGEKRGVRDFKMTMGPKGLGTMESTKENGIEEKKRIIVRESSDAPTIKK